MAKRMICRYCTAIFALEECSKPLERPSMFGFVNISEICPKCGKGFPEKWYQSEWDEKEWNRILLKRAIRYQKNVPQGAVA